jgi:hypothetical protein
MKPQVVHHLKGATKKPKVRHCPKKLPNQALVQTVQVSSFITEFKGEGEYLDLMLNSGEQNDSSRQDEERQIRQTVSICSSNV